VLARAVNLLRLRAEARLLVAAVQPDLIHAHSAGAYAWMAMLLGFHPFLVTPWGNDVLIDVYRSRMSRFLTARALRRADRLHGEGENTREAMIRLGADPQKIVIGPFGVDVKKFAPGEPPPELLKRFDLAGRKVVISTRTLNPIHDVKTVIHAIPLVLEKAPTTKFLVVGGGVESQALQDLAKSLGIAHATVFAGHLKEAEMIACLRAAHVYVSTSLSESGTALSTAEAMACGLPVINTDTGDIRMWIQDGKGGYVVPVSRPDVVADRIVHLLGHEVECKESGVVNRKTIEERNNVYIEMAKMESLYRDVIAQYKAR
jgi:glycosyltransferase involved in cell wall biosynthesis